MLESLAELRNSDLLSEEAVEDLKQRVLEDEFNAGVSGEQPRKPIANRGVSRSQHLVDCGRS